MKESPAPSADLAVWRPPTTGRLIRRVVLVLLMSMVLAALGLAVSGSIGGKTQPETITATARAQLQAEQHASTLSASATELASSAPGELPEQYLRSARLLEEQAAALALPVTPAEGMAVTGTTPSTPPASATAFLDQLAKSAAANLDTAGWAEPGIARLLASAGTSQWEQVLALAKLQDVPIPPAPAVSADPLPEVATDCADSPGPLTAAETNALHAAVDSEHAAAYAYEVAAARAADPDGFVRLSRLHSDHAMLGSEILAAGCAEVPPAPAAFRLQPGFLADPAASLARLEIELTGLYADMVGRSDGAARHWAIARLFESALRRPADVRATDPFPGIGAHL